VPPPLGGGMSGDGKNGNTDARQDGETPSDKGERDAETVRLLAEELAVTRQQVETGRVRVQVVTREDEQLVDVPLVHQRVEVERVAINRPVEAIPPTRQEGDVTILPVVEEVVTVERRLILKEELHVRLVRTTEQHQERVVLRRQEAVITRIPADAPEKDPKGE